MATSLLHDIVKSVGSSKVTVYSTEKETRVLCVRNVEMHISVKRSAVFSRVSEALDVRTQDFLKLLRETRVFGDIDFSAEKRTATLLLEEGESVVSLECPVARGEGSACPPVPTQILCSVDPHLVKEIATEGASSVEILFSDESVKITAVGEIKTEGEHRGVEYIKRETDRRLFVVPAEAFAPLVSLCRLQPHRVIVGADTHVCTVYLYYKDVTVIVYAQGTLV